MPVRVPASFPISLTQVVAAVQDHTPATTLDLNSCIANAIYSYYDTTSLSTYPVNSQNRFLNYGPPLAPPTYIWEALINGQPISTSGETVATECNALIFRVTTTNVPDGTMFTLVKISPNYLGHYTLNGVPNVDYIDVYLLNNTAEVTIQFIVDRVVEPDGYISFLFRRSDQPQENISRTVLLKDHNPPSYITNICGTWGPTLHSTELEINIYGDCSGIKLIESIELIRISAVNGFQIPLNVWSYADISSFVGGATLSFTEYGDPSYPDLIRDGGRYEYFTRINDIYGGATISQHFYVSCRAYLDIKLSFFTVVNDGFPFGWRASMQLLVSTNMLYGKSGEVTAAPLNGPDANTYSSHSFSINSPLSAQTLFSNNQPAYSAMDDTQIVFGTAGSMFTALCGEQITVDIPSGLMEPINR